MPGSTKKGWKPTTRAGWWSAWLMLAYVVMDFITLAGIGLKIFLPPFVWMPGTCHLLA